MYDKCPECGYNEFWGNRVYFPVYKIVDGKLMYLGHKERTAKGIECHNCGWKVSKDIGFCHITPDLIQNPPSIPPI